MLIGATLLAAVVFLNSFNFTLAGSSGSFRVHGMVILRLALCGACGLFGLHHLRFIANQLFKFPGAWITLFGLWTFVTLPFAGDISYSAGASFALWCMILFAPAVLHQLGGRRVVLAILVGLVVYCIGSWILFFVWPEVGIYAHDPARLGNNANELGIQAIWAIGLFLMLRSLRYITLPAVLFSTAFLAVTIYFTGSRMAIGTALAVAGFFFLRKAKTPSIVMLGFIFTSAVVLVCLAISSGITAVDPDEVVQGLSRSGNAEEIYSFTGRTVIWEYALEKVRESPWIGYGHGGSRYALAWFSNWGYGENDLHHAHNLLLNVTLSTGFIGGFLVLAMLLSQLLRLFRAPVDFPDLAVVVVLLAGLTEPAILGPMPRGSTLIWLIALFWRQMGASLTAELGHINNRGQVNADMNRTTANSEGFERYEGPHHQ
jgi:O-antigen ligase